jgi:cation diffusion facilitator family transporter
VTEATQQHALFDTTNPQRYAASRQVAYVSVAGNLVLTSGQILVGIVGHSQALVADGFHTLSDLVTDFMVLFALKHGTKAADAEHPYGHARIETAVTVALGLILLLVGIGIGVRGVLRLHSDEPFISPSSLTLWVAGFTILAKEAMYQYTMRTARRYDSELLRASAWHHRSDAISSIIVFVGIAGSIAGVHYMDALAAISVALFVAKVGIELGWPAVSELIDTGLEPEHVKHLEAAILSVDGVQAMHMLRTRRTGGRALVDVHIIVDERISVSEGHYISEAVRAKLIAEIDVVADVMVHIDPEDDLVTTPTNTLPSRAVVRARLNEYFRDIPQAGQIQRLTLHYIDGSIHVEVTLPRAAAPDAATADALVKRLREAVVPSREIADLEVYFH